MAANHSHPTVDITAERRFLEGLGPQIVNVGLLAGGAGLVASFAFGAGNLDRLLHGYLLNYCFFLSIALGALAFVMIQHLVASGWSVVVRRVAEVLMGTLPIMGVLLSPILVAVLFGNHDLYEWADPAVVASDKILEDKSPYLNVPFFLVRMLLYFGVWIGLSRYFLGNSQAQDESGDPDITVRMRSMAAPGLLMFALTITFCAVDLLMSLAPHWFSTIFGVYYFAGAMVAFYATLAVALNFLQQNGRLANAVNEEHYHDVGKFLFGHTAFWAYIAFSQFMLIWYANIPEETGWYLPRMSAGWTTVGVALMLGHFFLPFFGLMPRDVKRSRYALLGWAAWLLAMHWIDLYYIVMPNAGPHRGATHPSPAALHVLDFTTFFAVGGFFVAWAAFVAGDKPLVPVKDPRLGESLGHVNSY